MNCIITMYDVSDGEETWYDVSNVGWCGVMLPLHTLPSAFRYLGHVDWAW